jgi:Domain of unknown function (DUF4129)
MTSQRHGPGPAQDWVLRIIPLTLLIILAMAGLRGAVARPKWTGSHHADVVIGIVLFVVFATLFGIILARRRAALRTASGNEEGMDPPGKLRVALMFILFFAMAADVIAVLYGLHLKLPKPKPRRNALGAQSQTPPPLKTGHLTGPGHGANFPLADVLWGLLVVLLIAVVVLTLRWLAQQTRVREIDEDDVIAEDSADLREAVESGRSALRTFDDAKSAIIACYVAMEASLAERGAARTMADTPDELLARATQTQIVHGTAPARLTALFYEARFSSHPMDQSQRQAAEQALNELAQALDDHSREPQQAGA